MIEIKPRPLGVLRSQFSESQRGGQKQILCDLSFCGELVVLEHKQYRFVFLVESLHLESCRPLFLFTFYLHKSEKIAAAG